MRKQFDFHNCFHRTIKVKTESNYLLWGNCEINLKKKTDSVAKRHFNCG